MTDNTNNRTQDPALGDATRVAGTEGLVQAAQAGNPFIITAECAERFTRVFEVSARRWQMVVYPSLFAFVVLAAYGFYLIYSLSHDIHNLTYRVAELTASVETMAHDMDVVAANMQVVSSSMVDVSHKLNSLAPMQASMESMNVSMDSMNNSTRMMTVTSAAMNNHMGRLNTGMWHMNRSFTPTGMFTNFMRW